MTKFHANKLRIQLLKPLPGMAAHQELMPAMRMKQFEGFDTSNLRESAVMLIIENSESNPQIIFQKRVKDDTPHSGQVSFPGGKQDPEDANLLQTALRECYEEINISTEELTILGSLSSLIIPVSGFRVHVFVAHSPTTLNTIANAEEVDYLFSVPINFLLQPESRHMIKISARGTEFTAPCFRYNNEIIWGATAMILNEFIKVYKSIIEQP